MPWHASHHILIQTWLAHPQSGSEPFCRQVTNLQPKSEYQAIKAQIRTTSKDKLRVTITMSQQVFQTLSRHCYILSLEPLGFTSNQGIWMAMIMEPNTITEATICGAY